MPTLNASPVLRRMKSWERVGQCVSVRSVGLRDAMALFKDIDIYQFLALHLLAFLQNVYLASAFFKKLGYILTQLPNVL